MPTRIALKEQHKLYHYVATVIDVYDGDTITVDLDLGVGIWRRDQTIRLWKIDTPEVRGAERERGIQVRDFLRTLILGKTILVRTILDRRGNDQTGKFGRLLGEVLAEDAAGVLVNVNQLLLDMGYALPLDADGSALPTAPLPLADSAPQRWGIQCPYCGEIRAITATGVVEACPNCLDEPFPLQVT